MDKGETGDWCEQLSIRQPLMHYAKKPNTVNYLNPPIILLFPHQPLRPISPQVSHPNRLTTPNIRHKIEMLKPPKPPRAFFNRLIHSKSKVLAMTMISHDRGLVPGPLDPGSVAFDALWVEARLSVPLAAEPTGSPAIVVELDVHAVVESVVPGAFGSHAGLDEGEDEKEGGEEMGGEIHDCWV